MIEVKNLTKKYGSHLAVDNISFKIEKGNVYGFLGPNGAGKSTTMNIITGCLAATDGSVLIDGHDIFEEPDKAKKHIGYLPEIPPLYADMTPYEYLMFVAEAKKVSPNKRYPQVKEVIDITGLEDVAGRLIRNLSKGYKQRVGIAQAMLGDPDVIILDEPTVGLDPKQIIEIRRLIKELGKIKTVILSSHILSEISSVCNHIIIISHGKIVANDTTENLINNFTAASGYEIVIKKKSGIQSLLTRIEAITGEECVYEEENGEIKITAKLSSSEDLREKLFELLVSNGAKVLELKKITTMLETVFLSLTDQASLSSASDEEDYTDEDDEDDDIEEDNNNETNNNSNNDDDYKSLFSTDGGEN